MGKLIVLLGALALVAGSCSVEAGIAIEDVWARTSAGTQDAGAVYMTITGGDEPDRLIGVSVASDVAAVAELHETAMVEGDDSGMMSMRHVSAIDIPAGGQATLAPGGFHVMLMELIEPLATGASFELTLTFENAGMIQISVEVREE